MALKRLDEEFDLKPGTQLLPYMQRLLPSLEGRFQNLETERKTYAMAVEDMRAVALMRINEILIPATEAITEVTKLGFLLGPSSSSVKLELGSKIFLIDEGPQRETFTPSPYVIVERTANITDYAIARVEYYEQDTGVLSLNITAWHGNQGPFNDWVISSTPGMADSTKTYHDAVGPMYDQVVLDAAQVASDKVAVKQAADALFAAGLDAQSFIRKDGTVPFQAIQKGVSAVQGSNDTTLATTAWARARMQEYNALSVPIAGGVTMGPLYLSRTPVAANEAATKSYVDGIIGQGGTISGLLTIQTVNPTIRLQVTGAGQSRMIDGYGPSGMRKWTLYLGDSSAESGTSTGSNFALNRYNNTGVVMDTPLWIDRGSGATTTLGLNVNGTLNVNNANLNLSGDLWSYRPNTNTGVLYLGNNRTAYHYWDGATHVFAAGGGSFGGSPLSSGHLTCYSIYTQGYGATVWGITVHGVSNLNNDVTINGQLNLTGRNANYIQLYDTDWGPMHIHHNQDLIGFLNNGGGWCFWATNAGHVWSAQYGWFHDYVNNTAYNYAWDAANYRYNQLVSKVRWVHAGDIDFGSAWYQFQEIWNACITGLNMATPYWGGPGVFMARWRQCQHMIAGGWYTSAWES